MIEAGGEGEMGMGMGGGIDGNIDYGLHRLFWGLWMELRNGLMSVS